MSTKSMSCSPDGFTDSQSQIPIFRHFVLMFKKDLVDFVKTKRNHDDLETHTIIRLYELHYEDSKFGIENS